MTMSMYYVISSYVCKDLSVNKGYVLFCSVQQRVLNNQTTVRRFSTRFFAKQGTWLVSLLHVLPKKNVHYQVHFGIYVL